MPERTGQQVIVKRRYDGRVYNGASPSKIREMRKDPVISLIRTMLFAGVLSGEWSVEHEQTDDPAIPEIVAFIKEQMMAVRLHLLRTGVCGCFDFGWQPYEKIFDVDTTRLMIVLKKLKPLVQDNTSIRTTESDGSFAGFVNNGIVELSIEESLLLNFDVEGTMWQGQSQIELAEEYYDEKKVTRATAQRYDKKMAGSHWVIKYPIGKSPMPGSKEDVPNSEIADKILDTLEASGLIAIPQAQSKLNAMNKNGEQAWSIELITGDGAVLEFTERFNYQDKCIARVLGWPERAILEGQFGTKAEADAHGDFVITMIEYRHDCLLELINWHLVNHLIRLNWGSQYENTVWLKAAKLNDAAKAQMQAIYDKILTNPDGFLQEIDLIDTDAIAQALGIPRKAISPDALPVVQGEVDEEAGSGTADATVDSTTSTKSFEEVYGLQ